MTAIHRESGGGKEVSASVGEETSAVEQKKQLPPAIHRVGVVGGGPAAVSFCIQLLPKLLSSYQEAALHNKQQQHSPHAATPAVGGVELLVFERGERVGPGLAYTIDPDGNTYRINRTRDTMDPWSGSIGRYTAWAEEHGDGADESMSDYPLRSNYGKFMVYLMDELKRVSERPGSRLRVECHTRTTVEDITTSSANSNKYVIHTTGDGGGEKWEVDTVVLCTGHYPGATFRELIGKPNYAYEYAGYKPLIRKVTEAEAARGQDLNVGIIGSAYAAIDVALELVARGHRGKIWMATEKPRRAGRRKASSVLTEIYSSDPYLGSAYSEYLGQQSQAGTRRLSVMLDQTGSIGGGGGGSAGGGGSNGSFGGSKLLDGIRQLIGRLDLASRPSARLKYLGGFTLTNPLAAERRTSLERSLICTNPVLTTIKENGDDGTGKQREHVVAMPTIITFGSAQRDQRRRSLFGSDGAKSQTISIPLATVLENRSVESNGTAGGRHLLSPHQQPEQPQHKPSQVKRNSIAVRHYRLTHVDLDTMQKPLRAEEVVSRVFAEISDLQGSRITFDDLLALHRERTPIELLNEHIACSEAGVVRPWQLVMFTLGPLFAQLWNELDDEEQKLYRDKYHIYFLRYANYIPLESAQKLRNMMMKGKLALLPGLHRIKVVAPAANGDARAGGDGEKEVKEVETIVANSCFELEGFENDVATTHGVYALFNASGLSSSAAEVPPLANMLKSRLVTPHHFGGVLINRETHQTLDASGATNEGIYAIGEPCRGYFFISLDMATVAEQAEKVAGQVAKRIAASLLSPTAAMREKGKRVH